MPFNPKWVAGKTVARVEMNPFPAREGRRSEIAHNPHIVFTDGSAIRFVTSETDFGDYGTEIVYLKPPKRQA